MSLARFDIQCLVLLLIIISITGGLWLHFNQLEQARTSELMRLEGNDENTRLYRIEAEDYRLLNQKQKTGVLVVGGVLLLILGSFWIRNHRPNIE